MSIEQNFCLASLPSTERGLPSVMGIHPKKNKMMYGTRRSLIMREINNPEKVEIYDGHAANVTSGRWSPNGYYAASGDATGKVRVWSPDHAEKLTKVEFVPFGGQVNDLGWTEDNKRIACVGKGSELMGAAVMFDTGNNVGKVTNHTKPCLSCDVKQTRPYRLVTASEDFSVNLFEGPPFKILKQLKEHTMQVNCVRYAPNGEKMCSVSSDRTGVIYDGKDGSVVCKFSDKDKHNGAITSCSWSPDSKQIATCSMDKSVKVWDDAGNCVGTLALGDKNIADQQVNIEWVSDELIISTNLIGHLTYINPKDLSKPAKVVYGHAKPVVAMDYDTVNKKIVSASADQLKDKNLFATLVTDPVSFNVEAPVYDGCHKVTVSNIKVLGGIAYSTGGDGLLKGFDVAKKAFLPHSVSLGKTAQDLAVQGKDLAVVGLIDSITAVRVSADGFKEVASAKLSFDLHSVAISPDEKTVVVGDSKGNVHTFDFSGTSLKATGKKYEGQQGKAVKVLAYSKDGKYLAAGGVGKQLYLLDPTADYKEIDFWQKHTGAITQIAWHEDNQHFATSGVDGLVMLWDTKSNKTFSRPRCHLDGGANALVWADANTLYTGGADCLIKGWTVKF